MLFINSINNILRERVNVFGAPYLTFAIFGIINYPLSYLYYLVNNSGYENLGLRLSATILCLVLLLQKYWPESVKKYLPLYWYCTLLFCLPFFGTYLLLENKFSQAWLMNNVLGVLLLILLADWLMFILLLCLGIGLGVLFFTLQGEVIAWKVNNQAIIQAIYMYVFVIVLGGLFSRNKELIAASRARMMKEIEKVNFQLEEKVIERTKALQVALSVKQDFLNNMSHEIRTPVHGVIAITGALKEDWHLLTAEERYEYVTKIAKSAERLYALVTNILDLSKSNAGKLNYHFELYDIYTITMNIVEELNSLAMQKPGCIIKLDPPPASVSTSINIDPLRIEQVLRNVITNAIKYGEGTIKVKLEPASLESNGKVEEGLACSITDEGPGIPENELEHIFDAFIQSSRTKTRAGGTGLGLSICREIIQAHKGLISAYTLQPKGAKFVFILPRTM